MRKITIIGGGASGTLLAINLLKAAKSDEVLINLVESRSRIGRGVAFGTPTDTHLLNVPAGKMGAYPDHIGHFHEWLVDRGHNFEPTSFVPRRLFGEYLRQLLETEANNGTAAKLNIIDDEAVDMSVNGNSAEVILRSGEILPTDRVVLAFGNFKPPHPTVADISFTSSPNYFQDPWNSRLYENVVADQSLFIVGTGLSMVDVVLHFKKLGHRGKISAISTRGLLPAVHKYADPYPAFDEELRPMRRITDIHKAVRTRIVAAEAEGKDWRGVIDSLRPSTQQIWLDLPTAEKRYFMQHLSRYWNVARHRMPPEAAVVIDQMSADGKLDILKGRLKRIDLDSDGCFDIAFTSNGTTNQTSADVLINCIGSEMSFAKVDSQFVRALISRGHIRNDQLSLGIDAAPDGRVVDKTGQHSPVVHTLGTALRGILWESTAIPEIRAQAKLLALKLLAN